MKMVDDKVAIIHGRGNKIQEIVEVIKKEHTSVNAYPKGSSNFDLRGAINALYDVYFTRGTGNIRIKTKAKMPTTLFIILDEGVVVDLGPITTRKLSKIAQSMKVIVHSVSDDPSLSMVHGLFDNLERYAYFTIVNKEAYTKIFPTEKEKGTTELTAEDLILTLPSLDKYKSRLFTNILIQNQYTEAITHQDCEYAVSSIISSFKVDDYLIEALKAKLSSIDVIRVLDDSSGMVRIINNGLKNSDFMDFAYSMLSDKQTIEKEKDMISYRAGIIKF